MRCVRIIMEEYEGTDLVRTTTVQENQRPYQDSDELAVRAVARMVHLYSPQINALTERVAAILRSAVNPDLPDLPAETTMAARGVAVVNPDHDPQHEITQRRL